MKTKLFLSIATVAIFAFIGCTDADDSSPEMGRLTVLLTDAPFPTDLVSEANVTIYRIEARYKGSAHVEEDVEDYMEEETEDMTVEDSSDDMEEDGDTKFITIMEAEYTVNLLDLKNGVTAKLAELEVTEGTYDLLRVYVKGVNVVLADGTEFELTVPSGSQTGIKIFIKPALVVSGGLSSDLLLDFDVCQSFVVKGNSNDLEGIKGFNFKPVIKVRNLSKSGTLKGTVSSIQEDGSLLGLEGVTISVLNADGSQNTMSISDDSGGYMVMGLMAGTYTIVFERDGFVSQTFEGVTIIAANNTLLDATMEPNP
ncbi:MAG: DUF4382 domain-containing protein [Flavobacteriales bacterium]|nr:MAG: DUF4382 domain-containing protein [Flavobacteriales bacterium]